MAYAQYIYPSACALTLFLFANVSVDGQYKNNAVEQGSSTTVNLVPTGNETEVLGGNISKYGK